MLITPHGAIVPKGDPIVLASPLLAVHDVLFTASQPMKIFAGLKKIREFEKLQLPFVRSIVDLDIVIEIGYAEERGRPLSLKQLFLLEITSKSSVRRHLHRLIHDGIIVRRRDANDHRSVSLEVSASSLRILNKYANTITGISALHFG